MMPGKATLTFNFTKDEKGVVSYETDIQSTDLAIYEIIGLLELVKVDLMKASKERAQELTTKKSTT